VPSPESAVEPPIWCAYLASALGADEILDAEAEGLSPEQTIERIGNKKPVFVAMGSNPSASSTPKMPFIEQLIKRFPKYIIAGLHPQAVGHAKLLRLPLPAVLRQVIPSWHLLEFSRYRAHNWHCLHDLKDRQNYGVIFTSFGCPFNCFNCNIHSLYGGRSVSFRDPVDVIDEIDVLVKEHGVRNLKICDELFALNKTHVNQICDMLISRDYRLNIWAYARVDTVDAGLLKKLKRAGVNWLAYGFESAVKEVRGQSAKIFTDSTAERAIDITRDAGINIMANFMFGLPGETENNMKASLDMAMSHNFEYVNFYVALPYPGSNWYAGLKDKPINWDSFSQFSPTICADPAVVRFRDEAFNTYYSRPEYLSMVRSRFGQKAEEHIKNMLQWQIVRNT